MNFNNKLIYKSKTYTIRRIYIYICNKSCCIQQQINNPNTIGIKLITTRVHGKRVKKGKPKNTYISCKHGTRNLLTLSKVT